MDTTWGTWGERAQRVGWKVVVASVTCDTSIAWITPTPSTPVSGGEP